MARRVRRNMSRLQKLEKDAENLEMHLDDVSKNFLAQAVKQANSDQAGKFEYHDVVDIDLPRQKAEERKLVRLQHQIKALQASKQEV